MDLISPPPRSLLPPGPVFLPQHNAWTPRLRDDLVVGEESFLPISELTYHASQRRLGVIGSLDASQFSGSEGDSEGDK